VVVAIVKAITLAALEMTFLALPAVFAAWVVWWQRNDRRYSLRSLFLLTAVCAALFAFVGWEGSIASWIRWLSGSAEAPLLSIASFLLTQIATCVVFWTVGAAFFSVPPEGIRAAGRVYSRRWRGLARTTLYRRFLWVPDSLWLVVFYVVFHAFWIMLFPLFSVLTYTPWTVVDRSLCLMLHLVNAGFIVFLSVDLLGQMSREGWRFERRHIPYLIALWLLLTFQLHLRYLPMYQFEGVR
jgi:hypothetical protein